jgi:(4S)-4-hydroxy-5-phosphonooxypentane-2,3-dione isomerase
MHFRINEDKKFLLIFEASKYLIRNFPGCRNLELLRDVRHEGVYFTISIWESELALENYRNSDLFKNTWQQTKTLFETKAVAWSLSEVFNSEMGQ